MTQTFSADVKRFVELTEKQMRRVVVDSLFDVVEGAQTSAKGVTAGGTIQAGKIPVVSGDLINSLTVEINGTLGPKGKNSYEVALANYEIGDYMRFGWTMEYAMRVENGFTGTDETGRTFNQSGWHFVGRNAAKWPHIIEGYIRKYLVKP